MPRIGDVLIASGLLEEHQLAEALRAQVMWGGRIGTALVELGHVKLDALAVALGRLHALPAALAAHFERADPSLRIPRDLAEQLACAPLARAGKRIVIVSASPLRAQDLERIGGALGIAGELVIASIAPELRVRYFLEHEYDIPRPPRFLRVRGATSRQFAEMPELDEPPAPPPPAEASDGVPLAPVLELPSGVLAGEQPARMTPWERRRYVETLADLAGDDVSREALAKQLAATPRLAVGTSETPLASGDPAQLAGALAAIEGALDREDVARLVLDAIARFEPSVSAALLLAIRGIAAASWTGFSRDGSKLPALAVPLDHPGLVPGTLRKQQARRGASGDLGTIDYLLLASLGAPEHDLAIVPIAVADRTVGMLALAVVAGLPLTCTEAIARAAGAGFTRLMREAKRGVGGPEENTLGRVDLQRSRSSPE